VPGAATTDLRILVRSWWANLDVWCRQLQGYRHPIVPRGLQTLSGHPDRLHNWMQAAIEMAGRYAQICGGGTLAGGCGCSRAA
jgi:hypothetical protein